MIQYLWTAINVKENPFEIPLIYNFKHNTRLTSNTTKKAEIIVDTGAVKKIKEKKIAEKQ